MFGIGETELLIILAFGFMIFGPDKLPGMGRTIGRALRQFRQAQEGFTEVMQAEVMDPLQEAMGDPLDTGTRKQRRATAEERAAALAADADIDAGAEEATAVHKETFAERKARLAAERKAREDEQKAREAELAQARAVDEDAPAVTEEVAEPEAAPESEKPDTSAAALYAIGGRSAYAHGKQEEAEKKAAEEAAKQAEAEQKAAEEAAKQAEAEQKAAEEAAKEADATEGAATTTPLGASDAMDQAATSDGKEDGSAEA